MDIEMRSRANVDGRLARLHDKFGDFPIEEETVTNDPAYFESGREGILDGWIGDAGAWVTDADGRVLLIRHVDDPDRWGTPGGGHEPGESLAGTARREVSEETGVECSLTDIVWARRKIAIHENDPDARFHVLTVIFEAAYEGGGIDIGDDEILEARWFEDPPDAVHDFIEPKLADWACE